MANKPACVTLSAQSNVSGGGQLSIEVSSQAMTSCVWTVERRTTADGPASPISLAWDKPISGFQLWGYLMDRRAAGDADFRSYRFLKGYPTIEGGAQP